MDSYFHCHIGIIEYSSGVVNFFRISQCNSGTIFLPIRTGSVYLAQTCTCTCRKFYLCGTCWILDHYSLYWWAIVTTVWDLVSWYTVGVVTTSTIYHDTKFHIVTIFSVKCPIHHVNTAPYKLGLSWPSLSPTSPCVFIFAVVFAFAFAFATFAFAKHTKPFLNNF